MANFLFCNYPLQAFDLGEGSGVNFICDANQSDWYTEQDLALYWQSSEGMPRLHHIECETRGSNESYNSCPLDLATPRTDTELLEYVAVLLSDSATVDIDQNTMDTFTVFSMALAVFIGFMVGQQR